MKRGMSCAVSLAAAAVAILSNSGTAHASTAHLLPVDTLPEVREDGPRRLLFSPQYLSRILKSSLPGDADATMTTEVERPMVEGQAVANARRYNIPIALALQITESAIAEGVDPDLGFRLVRVESVFNPRARSPGGALGLMQLMPSTARAIDRSLTTEAKIMDPENNLRTGFRYLRRMIERYEGDVRLGLLAYNRGETAVDRALRAGRDPENGYSGKVLNLTGRDEYRGDGLIDSPD